MIESKDLLYCIPDLTSSWKIASATKWYSPWNFINTIKENWRQGNSQGSLRPYILPFYNVIRVYIDHILTPQHKLDFIYYNKFIKISTK